MADRASVHHIPVVGEQSDHPHGHAVVVFDAETGQTIGHNPNYKVEQVSLEKSRGTVTTTLKIRHVKDS
jgi:hypothetical protein